LFETVNHHGIFAERGQMQISRLIKATVAITLLTACTRDQQNESVHIDGKPAKQIEVATPASGATIPGWDAKRCGDDDYQNEKLQRHPAIMGLAPDALSAAYGIPSAQEYFLVGKPSGTFYGAYGKRLNGPKAINHGAPGYVITWTKSGCNFSVFFLKQGDTWKATEAFEWAVGAEF
jgi:hypothetical protein